MDGIHVPQPTLVTQEEATKDPKEQLLVEDEL